MNIQRLRNLTTGKLHTKIDCVYQDLERIMGEPMMTHMIPRACRAITPWLKRVVTDQRFWDDRYDPKHTGTIDLPDPSDEDRKEMVEAYLAQPDPLAGKEVIVVNH